MHRLDEILGAVNYWLDQRGTAHSVSDHVEWACRYLRVREPSPMDPDGHKRIRNAMFDRGFVRVSIDSNRIGVDYRQIRNAQLDWLREQADARDVPVKDDEGNEIYRPGMEESIASDVVSALLGEDTRIA